MSRHISIYLCLLMLSLQLSVYIKSIQYNDYAPIASLVVFSCLFSAYFIPWSFKYHLAVTAGALLLVSHWMYGFANATDWLTAARGTFTVAAVCVATAVLAYFNDGKRLSDWEEKQNLLRSDRMFKQFAEHTSDVVFIWNPDLTLDYASPSFEQYTGRTVKQLTTTSLKVSDVIDPDQIDFYRKETNEVVAGQERKGDLTVVHTNGTRFTMEAVGSPIFGPNGTVEKAIAVWRDITARTAMELSLQQQVSQDFLTKTLNKEYFQKIAVEELERASISAHPVSFLFLDVDEFRKITEGFGLFAGDEVLIELVDRCRKELGEDSIICRFGGDSLLVMMPGNTAEDSEAVALSLIARVGEQPIVYKDNLLPISICVGIACCDAGAEESSNYEEILDLSAKALYEAKRQGRGSCAIRQPAAV